MERTNYRGSLSHHGGRHAVDPGKAMDKLFDKVLLAVVLIVLVIGALVYIV